MLYGSDLLHRESQIHTIALSAEILHLVLSDSTIAERYVKTHVARQLPTDYTSKQPHMHILFQPVRAGNNICLKKKKEIGCLKGARFSFCAKPSGFSP